MEVECVLHGAWSLLMQFFMKVSVAIRLCDQGPELFKNWSYRTMLI